MIRGLKLLFITGVTSFATLFSFTSNVNKEEVKIKAGDVLSSGEIVDKTDVDVSKMVRFKPMVTPSDEYYSTQKSYSMNNVGDIETTWDYYKGKGTTIAIIDSGIEFDHEDFIDEEGNSHISEDSAFFYVSGTLVVHKVAKTDGWEILKHEYFDYYEEWVDHGSNVASSAASLINGVGTVGIAPEATLLVLKVDLYDPSIEAAIRYAVDCGADVINMSLGSYDSSDPHTSEDSGEGTAEYFTNAINYAYDHDVIVVAAAGNERTDAKSYPACNSHVIGVGALRRNGNTRDLAFTNYNKTTDTVSSNHNVDILAPGYVYTAGLDASELGDESKYPSAGYHSTQGTSFSSPIVAGAAALWKEKYQGSPDQFESALYASAYKPSDYSFRYYGNGNLNVYKLLDIEHDNIGIDYRNVSLNIKAGEDFTVKVTSRSSVITSCEIADSSVASINVTGINTNNVKINISPVAIGNTTITVRDNKGNSDTINVEVYDKNIIATGMKMSDTSKIIQVDTTYQLSLIFTPGNVTDKTAVWTSSDESIATVSETGLVTALKEGNVTITAKSNSNKILKATCSISIIKGPQILIKGCFGDASSTSIILSILSISEITIYLIARRKNKVHK